jgi:Xaa-Pro aminopeptidase
VEGERDLCDEVASRIGRARVAMREEGYTALLVYGNTKMNGALRYLSGYWPDRGGWLSRGPERKDINIFDASLLVLPLTGEPVLVFDKGELLDREACTARTTLSSFGGDLAWQPSEAEAIAALLRENEATGRVGIETWDKFPAPLYLDLRQLLPGIELVPSTLVEGLMLIKSPWEVAMFREGARIGDTGHEAFVSALREGGGRSELELVRAAEAVMRDADPIYEECSPISPSLISSGPVGRLCRLHVPLSTKIIMVGDAVNWDICMRYRGYPIDTSRTRVVGKPTGRQQRAYDISLGMSVEVRKAVKPGAQVQDLVRLAQSVAKEGGFELWDGFLGHGLGLDVHSRPDMGMEEMILSEGMVITVEPRLDADGWLYGNEDMVLVTADGCDTLTSFPREPLELHAAKPLAVRL